MSDRLYKNVMQYLSKWPKIYARARSARWFPSRFARLVKETIYPEVQKPAFGTYKFNHYGDLHQDKALYYICPPLAGFMNYFRVTVEALAVADFFHFTPVVDWNNKYYRRDGSASERDNVFDYYFEQPGGISAEEAMHSYCMALGNTTEHRIVINDADFYDRMEDADVKYTPIMEKYIKLNAPTQRYIEEHVKNILGGGKTLGIHVRKFLMTANHPVNIEPTEFIAKAKGVIKQHGYERIFLATNHEPYIKEFKNYFGDMMVHYRDIYRGTEVAIPDNPRPNHRYLQGLEVLRDVYTLAACRGLIAGVSNVPFVATLANGNHYEYKEIINNGIYDKYGKSEKSQILLQLSKDMREQEKENKKRGIIS